MWVGRSLVAVSQLLGYFHNGGRCFIRQCEVSRFLLMADDIEIWELALESIVVSATLWCTFSLVREQRRLKMRRGGLVGIGVDWAGREETE